MSGTTSSLPTQLGDVADLTAFLQGLDPSTTLLDVKAIASATVATEGMGQHGGLSGAMTRIALTYTATTGDDCSRLHRPATIICKTNRDTDQGRAHAKGMQLPREALFLKHVRDLQTAVATNAGVAGDVDVSSSLVAAMQRYAPSLVKGLPTIYYSEGDMERGTKMVLCEDLGVARTVVVNNKEITVSGVQSGWLLGPHSILNRGIDDLAGLVKGKGWVVVNDAADSAEVSSLMPISVLELVTSAFVTAAELHGAFWLKGDALLADPSTDANAPREYLRGAKWFVSSSSSSSSSVKDGSDDASSPSSLYAGGKALYEGSMQFAHSNWQGYLRRLKEEEEKSSATPYAIPPNVAALMQVCCPTEAIPSYEAFLGAFAARPHTLVHGDFHPGNMLVCGEDRGGKAHEKRRKEERAPTMVDPDTVRIALVDWEVVGIGSGPQDVGQYMTSHFTEEQFNTVALPAVAAYVQRLIETIALSSGGGDVHKYVASADLRGTIGREIVVGALGRWAWLLGVMGGMESISLDSMRYFNSQVDAFMRWALRADVADALGVSHIESAEALAKMVGMCRP